MNRNDPNARAGPDQPLSVRVRAGPRSTFDIRLSIEKDRQAHATLELRSFVRQFPRQRILEQCYDFLREADVPLAVRRKRLFDAFPEQAESATAEACRNSRSG